MGRKPLELVGKRFGRLLVISQAENHNGFTYWNCVCDCGKSVIVKGTNLAHGRTKSCGCLSSDLTSQRNRDNADGIYRDSRLYRIYYGMKTRCYNTSSASYARYGEREITVCDEWANDFLSFQKWAYESGYKPNLTIDRIDNDKGYYPENCRWTTVKEQSNNRCSNKKLLFDGIERTVSEWADITGIAKGIIYSRLRTGWDVEDSLTIPVSMFKGGKHVHQKIYQNGV